MFLIGILASCNKRINPDNMSRLYYFSTIRVDPATDSFLLQYFCFPFCFYKNKGLRKVQLEH